MDSHSVKNIDDRFVAIETNDLKTGNLKFDQVMFSCLVFTCERKFEVTFGIFSVLIAQTNDLESYLDIYPRISICFKISYDQKGENCDNLGLNN